MSCSISDADRAFAFNEGHNDAWNGKPPRENLGTCCKSIACILHQRYREGHRQGVTARYYYDKGFAAGQSL